MMVLNGWLPSATSRHFSRRRSQELIGSWKTSRCFRPGSVARNKAPSSFEQNSDLPNFDGPYRRAVMSLRLVRGGVFCVGKGIVVSSVLSAELRFGGALDPLEDSIERFPIGVRPRRLGMEVAIEVGHVRE